MQVALTLTPSEMLFRLYRLRWCAVGATFLVIGVAHWALGIEFATAPLYLLCISLAAWNVLVGLRLRRGWATTELEGFAHLALDTLALSALLYWGGGSTSPFVSLYLIPIAIAAAALPSRYAWGITAVAAGFYSALLLTTTFAPAPGGHVQHSGFAMHVFGMWVTFIIGALLLMTFVAGMATAVRKRDQSLARAREQMLRNEQITAIGALAAGAAHELSTPLSTMTMIVAELRERQAVSSTPDALTDENISTLEHQLTLCKHQINNLLGAAEQARGEAPAVRPLSQWLAAVVDRWRLMRPEIQATLNLDGVASDPAVMLDDSVAQSLINLLNNAADASLQNQAQGVAISARSDASQVEISIEDQGSGISMEDIERAGRLRFSTKPEGRGLGLVLSHVNLERIGGEVSLNQREQGGTCTQVSLPLAPLQAL